LHQWVAKALKTCKNQDFSPHFLVISSLKRIKYKCTNATCIIPQVDILVFLNCLAKISLCCIVSFVLFMSLSPKLGLNWALKTWLIYNAVISSIIEQILQYLAYLCLKKHAQNPDKSDFDIVKNKHSNWEILRQNCGQWSVNKVLLRFDLVTPTHSWSNLTKIY